MKCVIGDFFLPITIGLDRRVCCCYLLSVDGSWRICICKVGEANDVEKGKQKAERRRDEKREREETFNLCVRTSRFASHLMEILPRNCNRV